MFRKFICWFIIFGLSFLIENFGWTSQGNAFVWIHLIGSISILLLLLLACLFGLNNVIAKIGASTILVIITAGILCVTLFATWGATKLFDVSFAVAYQIMTFGQCLCDDDDDD